VGYVFVCLFLVFIDVRLLSFVRNQYNNR
jgi:hypothetical protein